MATKRTPVTARGVALLSLIAASEGGVMFLTQEEGAEAVEAGTAALDMTIAPPAEGLAAVRLTDAGKAALPKVKQTFELEAGVPLPTIKRGNGGGNRGSQYPFATMEIGQSFHVPKTSDNPDPSSRLSSSVSSAKAQFSVEEKDASGNVIMETANVKVFAKGADGKFIKDAAGKRVVASVTATVRPKMKTTRDFEVRAVGADDPKGEGARCWRTA